MNMTMIPAAFSARISLRQTTSFEATYLVLIFTCKSQRTYSFPNGYLALLERCSSMSEQNGGLVIAATMNLRILAP